MAKTMYLIALLLGAMSAEAGTQYGCPADVPARALAETYNDRWATAVTAGDRAALDALYAENAVLMPPTDETLIGRDRIGEFLTEFGEARRLERYSVDVVACELDGDTLNMAGVWGTATRDFSGRSNTITGNVLRVLDREADGNWQLRYEIWN